MDGDRPTAKRAPPSTSKSMFNRGTAAKAPQDPPAHCHFGRAGRRAHFPPSTATCWSLLISPFLMRHPPQKSSKPIVGATHDLSCHETAALKPLEANRPQKTGFWLQVFVVAGVPRRAQIHFPPPTATAPAAPSHFHFPPWQTARGNSFPPPLRRTGGNEKCTVLVAP